MSRGESSRHGRCVRTYVRLSHLRADGGASVPRNSRLDGAAQRQNLAHNKPNILLLVKVDLRTSYPGRQATLCF
jgi:hypothetical protein